MPPLLAACPTSETDHGIPVTAFGSIAEYSPVALPQGASCTGFRAYLSTGLPQYYSQSYEFFGHLEGDDGAVTSIALMSQGNTLVPGLQVPWLTTEEEGLILNPLATGDGPIATPAQRSRVMDQYGGDIGAYLAATGDPMTGQGSHYYSMPLVEVQSWSLRRGSAPVESGSGGLLFFDNLTETYNDTAAAIVSNGYSWTELSVQLPDTKQGMLIATTGQDEVKHLNYAMLAGAGSTHRANGTLAPTANWPQAAIDITADATDTWISPTSCYTYVLRYDVKLAASAGRPAADLTFTAAADDQELDVLHRSVYEGLFTYTGTLDGQPVSSYSWGEIQGTPPPSGSC